MVGRESPTDSLFDTRISTFDDDGGAYNQADAGGFIKLNALRLRIAANLRSKSAANLRSKSAAKLRSKTAPTLRSKKRGKR